VTRTSFVCQQCGHASAKWFGRCPSCDAWDAMVEEAGPAHRAPGPARAAVAVPYPEVASSDAERTSTGLPELDRVLGGGLVPGAVVLIGGEPGVGKSTLVLQAAAHLAASGSRVLYATGEESPAQLKLRGERLRVRASHLLVLAETDVDAVIDVARRERVVAVLVDSIQSARCAELSSVPGSVSQVRESAQRLVALAKATGIPVVLVGHATKEGSIAGPRTLEHVVDTVVSFEGDRHHAHRILRAQKNRFGRSDEIGVFTMGESGLEGVAHPSEIFLAERAGGAPGSAVLPALEGSRPLLVEIQALVGEGASGSPRRTALGIDPGRLALILAVAERCCGLALAARDVFVNVAGGLDVDEPAADLAVALAVASSLSGRALPDRATVLGELGLAGEVRSVGRIDARLREAARLGFSGAIVPGSAADVTVPGLRLRPVRHLADALAAAFSA